MDKIFNRYQMIVERRSIRLQLQEMLKGCRRMSLAKYCILYLLSKQDEIKPTVQDTGRQRRFGYSFDPDPYSIHWIADFLGYSPTVIEKHLNHLYWSYSFVERENDRYVLASHVEEIFSNTRNHIKVCRILFEWLACQSRLNQI